ncbi:MAG: hypothetical protein GY757_12430 [bacterium]|nr:hypothetical protein [bacterium]
MSKKSQIYINDKGIEAQTYTGFSWPCFFVGIFWYLAKGMVGKGFLALLLAFVSCGITWLIFPFMANGQYTQSLQARGFYPKEAEQPVEIEQEEVAEKEMVQV